MQLLQATVLSFSGTLADPPNWVLGAVQMVRPRGCSAVLIMQGRSVLMVGKARAWLLLPSWEGFERRKSGERLPLCPQAQSTVVLNLSHDGHGKDKAAAETCHLWPPFKLATLLEASKVVLHLSPLAMFACPQCHCIPPFSFFQTLSSPLLTPSLLVPCLFPSWAFRNPSSLASGGPRPMLTGLYLCGI